MLDEDRNTTRRAGTLSRFVSLAESRGVVKRREGRVGGSVGWVSAGRRPYVFATHPQPLPTSNGARTQSLTLGRLVVVGFTQGGDLGATVRAAVRPDGLGLLLPVSRGISRAADPAAEALRLRDAINVERVAAAAAAAAAKDAKATAVAAEHGWSPAKRSLADGLLEAGCVRSLGSSQSLLAPTPPKQMRWGSVASSLGSSLLL